MNPDKAYRELYQYEKDLQEKGLPYQTTLGNMAGYQNPT